jgi:hypothetical protein
MEGTEDSHVGLEFACGYGVTERVVGAGKASMGCWVSKLGEFIEMGEHGMVQEECTLESGGEEGYCDWEGGKYDPPGA